MNAPVHAEVLTRSKRTNQADLPLAAEGVLRYVWESKFGSILIEVKDDCVYVNGDQVAYFSPSWTAFQADRGRHFSVIVDGVSN